MHSFSHFTFGRLDGKWLRSSAIESPWFRIFGSIALWLCVSAGCGLLPPLILIGGSVSPSGIAGMVIADFLRSQFGLTGAGIATFAFGIFALYLASTFEVSTLMRWLSGPIAKWKAFLERRRALRQEKRHLAIDKAKAKASERVARQSNRVISVTDGGIQRNLQRQSAKFAKRLASRSRSRSFRSRAAIRSRSKRS